MAQIFTASADTRLRFIVLLLVLGMAGFFVFLGGYADSSYATLVGWFQHQPVPFSHQHHAGELGIDCRYCHTAVETSAEAGMPPTHVCMTCHSQIWTGADVLQPVRQSLAEDKPLVWHRVAKVPDYVYFNHAIHVDRGVPCVNCHGRVDQMPLLARGKPFQMQFCLDCHRDPAGSLRPPEQVTRMDWSGWDPTSEEHKLYGQLMVSAYGIEPRRLTDCSTCHR